MYFTLALARAALMTCSILLRAPPYRPLSAAAAHTHTSSVTRKHGKNCSCLALDAQGTAADCAACQLACSWAFCTLDTHKHTQTHTNTFVLLHNYTQLYTFTHTHTCCDTVIHTETHAIVHTHAHSYKQRQAECAFATCRLDHSSHTMQVHK